jgi:hypothetical protein
MNASTHLWPVGGERRGGPARSVLAILVRMSAWVTTCADYSAAAATYEQLSALSDQELLRRGLTRATLARDVCEALDSSRPKGNTNPSCKSVD